MVTISPSHFSDEMLLYLLSRNIPTLDFQIIFVPREIYMCQSNFRICPVKLNIYYCKKIIFFLLLAIILIGANLIAVTPNVSAQTIGSTCVQYDSDQKLIHISCKNIHLTDIFQTLNNASVLRIENGPGEKDGLANGKVWILNAGITIEKDGGLIIDSTDTSWLKMVPTPTIQQSVQIGLSDKENDTEINEDEQGEDSISKTTIRDDQIGTNNSYIKGQKPITVSRNNGDNPNGIHVFGSLKIDSVKITSWNPEKNEVITFDLGKRPGEEHTKSKYDTIEPRPFIRVSNRATGTSNITNSEIAYLGYSCSRCSGISYYGGIGSLVKGNNIHHLLKGFYSKAMGAMLVENNTFHDNYLYGIDPHTGTHDMIIRNNKAYRNNASAIICSKHCYNMLFEGNEVYNNGGFARGILLSINTTHSVVRGNYVHDQVSCFGSSRGSNFNTIEDNLLSNCNIAMNLADTSNNLISNNSIVGAQDAVVLRDLTNNIFHNKVQNSTNGIVILNSSAGDKSNIDKDREIDKVNIVAFLNNLTLANNMTGVKNPIIVRDSPPTRD